jgi:hypothetical protein
VLDPVSYKVIQCVVIEFAGDRRAKVGDKTIVDLHAGISKMSVARVFILGKAVEIAPQRDLAVGQWITARGGALARRFGLSPFSQGDPALKSSDCTRQTPQSRAVVRSERGAELGLVVHEGSKITGDDEPREVATVPVQQVADLSRHVALH